MNKLKTLVSSLIVLLGALFLILIIYVSILGDNDKINFLVTSLFNDIHARNYAPACVDLKGSTRLDLENDPDRCMNFCFLLELSLLKKFNLLENKDYVVEIKQNHFWIPYLTDDHVWVGIALRDKKKNMFQQYLNRFGKDDFVHDIIRVDRREGHWQIAEIKLAGTTLEPVFNELTATMDLNRYIVKTKTGFKLQENDINFKTLSPADRRLLEFSLYRLGARQ